MGGLGYTDRALKCGHLVNEEKNSHFNWDLFKYESLRVFCGTGMETFDNILSIWFNELHAA